MDNFNPPFNPPPDLPLEQKPSEHHFGVWGIVVSLLILVLLAGGGFYAYARDLWPFQPAYYSENEFLPNLIASLSKIKSSSYNSTGSFGVGPREAGAMPFQFSLAEEKRLLDEYQRDVERVREISLILEMLSSYYDSSSQNRRYPDSLTDLLASPRSGPRRVSANITDPGTNTEYTYESVEDGADFKLSVTFETSYTITAISKTNQNYLRFPEDPEDAEAGLRPLVTIDGQQAIFSSQNRSLSFYVPTKPPQPFLAKLANELERLPSDVKVSFSVAVSSGQNQEDSLSDWELVFGAQGDLSDLSYKINAEARRVGKNYYFRINNLPTLFFFNDLALVKGQWIEITPEAIESQASRFYSDLSYLMNNLESVETNYKEVRAKSQKLLRLVVDTANQTNLIRFRSQPRSERVESGERLIRYDIAFRQEAIISFYRRLIEAVRQDDDFDGFNLDSLLDEGLVTYLEGQEFKDVFNFYDTNTKFTFWLDQSGLPILVEHRLRVVPPDSAFQLKDKQINLVFSYHLGDINQPRSIAVPTGARPILDVLKDFGFNVSSSENQRNRAIRLASLSSVRAEAELLAEKNGNYGSKAFSLGPCGQEAGTIFGHKNIYELIMAAVDQDSSKTRCASSLRNYAVSVELGDKTNEDIYCIDSTGFSGSVDQHISGTGCPASSLNSSSL